MKRCVTLGFLLSALTVTGAVRGGHELPVYPSDYPHEIEMRTIAPEAAESLLRQSKIHAYLGNELNLSGSAPDMIAAVELLGSPGDDPHQPTIVIYKSGCDRLRGRACCCPKDQLEQSGCDSASLPDHAAPRRLSVPFDLAEAAKRRLLRHGGLASNPGSEAEGGRRCRETLARHREGSAGIGLGR